MGTRASIKTAATNGAELSEELKQKLPEKLENVEAMIALTCGAIIAFCVIGTIAAYIVIAHEAS